jgi:hypothetical protein
VQLKQIDPRVEVVGCKMKIFPIVGNRLEEKK